MMGRREVMEGELMKGGEREGKGEERTRGNRRNTIDLGSKGKGRGETRGAKMWCE